MSNKIILKRSAVASKVPLAADLDYGELAINYADGILYYKNAANGIGYLGGLGYTGSQGPIGYTGSKGDQGNAGYTGSAGSVAVATTPPTADFEGQLWFDSSTMKTFAYYDSYWVEVGSSEIGTLYNRATFSTTTPSLAAGESYNIDLPTYKSYALLRLYVSSQCWLRIYSDGSSRTADQSRVITEDPVPGSGVITEIISAAEMTQKITPFIIGGNLEEPPTTNMYIRVTNTSSSPAAITMQATIIRMEI